MQTGEHLLEIAALAEHLDGKFQVLEPMLSHGRPAPLGCEKAPASSPHVHHRSVDRKGPRHYLKAAAFRVRVDRLSRSVTDLCNFLTEIHALKIDLYLHSQGLDTSTLWARPCSRLPACSQSWSDRS